MDHGALMAQSSRRKRRKRGGDDEITIGTIQT